MKKFALLLLLPLLVLGAPPMATGAADTSDGDDLNHLRCPAHFLTCGGIRTDIGSGPDMWRRDPAWRTSWGSRLPMPRRPEHAASRGDGKKRLKELVVAILTSALIALQAFGKMMAGKPVALDSTVREAPPTFVKSPDVKFIVLDGVVDRDASEGICEVMHFYSNTPLGQRIAMHAAPSDTVARVKAKIQEKAGMHVVAQVLRYAGKELDDFRTLMDCGVDANSTFRLKWAPQAKLPTGATTKAEGRRAEQLADRKANQDGMAANVGMPASQVKVPTGKP